MEILLAIPALLVFLYSLYKLSADDHVLIRKNISLEQMFDVAFGTLWVSLLVSRIYYFLFDAKIKGNLFFAFFITEGGLSLAGALLGGMVTLYLIGRYKKMPIGRLFDFFTISLLFALPVGFICSILLYLKQPAVIIASTVSAVVYLVTAILFKKLLYPKLLNRTLKEGTMSIFFLLLFPIVSFAVSFIHLGKGIVPLVTFNNIVYVVFILVGMILYIKQERTRARKRV